MLLTEEQARTKWCPHARTVEATRTGSSSPRNRVVRPYDAPPLNAASNLMGCSCIASECMAWRVDSPAGEFPMKLADAKALIERYDNFVIVAEHDHPGGPNATVRRLADIGFCGLAGKVEG